MSVHWTLAVIAWFLGVGLATGALPASVPHASTAAYWATASVGVVAFFLSILLHELAHSLVAPAATACRPTASSSGCSAAWPASTATRRHPRPTD